MVESRQGYAALLAAGALVCCGGQSARTSGDKPSDMSGGSPSAGTSGQSSDAVGGSTDAGGSGGSSGSNGSAGTSAGGSSGSAGAGGSSGSAGAGGSSGSAGAGAGGSGMIDVTSDCTRWEEASLTDSCAQLLGCPTDLWSYVASVQDDDLDGPYHARVGCGLVEIEDSPTAFAGSTFVFQEEGSLAGYSLGSDQGWGPCNQNIYERGSRLDDCEAVRECDIAVDARNTKQICPCSCPDAAPPNGVAVDADVTCIYPSTLTGESKFVGCTLELTQAQEHARASRGALIVSGCNQTIVSMLGRDDDVVECVYGDGIWVGARRTEAEASKECANVDTWQTGKFTTCAEQTSCWLGTEGPPEGVQRCAEPG